MDATEYADAMTERLLAEGLARCPVQILPQGDPRPPPVGCVRVQCGDRDLVIPERAP